MMMNAEEYMLSIRAGGDLDAIEDLTLFGVNYQFAKINELDIEVFPEDLELEDLLNNNPSVLQQNYDRLTLIRYIDAMKSILEEDGFVDGGYSAGAPSSVVYGQTSGESHKKGGELYGEDFGSEGAYAANEEEEEEFNFLATEQPQAPESDVFEPLFPIKKELPEKKEEKEASEERRITQLIDAAQEKLVEKVIQRDKKQIALIWKNLLSRPQKVFENKAG